MRRLPTLLLGAGSIAISFGAGRVHANLRGARYTFGTQNSDAAYVALGVVFLVFAVGIGMPHQPRNKQSAIIAGAVAAGITAGTMALMVIVYPKLLPRFVVLSAPPLQGLWAMICTYGSLRLRKRQHRRDRVVAVLNRADSAALASQASMKFPVPEQAFTLAACVQPESVTALFQNSQAYLGSADSCSSSLFEAPFSDPPQGSSAMAAISNQNSGDSRPTGQPQLEGESPENSKIVSFILQPLVTEPLSALVQDLQATVLILSDEAQQDPSIVKQAADLHAGGLRVRNLEGFYDVWLGKLPISSLKQMALLTDIGEIHGSAYTHLKRFTDLLFGLAAGVLFVGITPVIWILNNIGNRGPLIYRQPRMGKGGQPFQIAKFRTMRPEELSATTPWTVANDPRITQFGRILRRTHLDELPQFWNILAGDLSVVGPRPEQPHYVDELRKKIPFYDLRHTVQPGLTGWAQVKYRYASTEADAFEKLQYDLYYLRHQSISLDFQIISRTIVSVLRAHGR